MNNQVQTKHYSSTSFLIIDTKIYKFINRNIKSISLMKTQIYNQLNIKISQKSMEQIQRQRQEPVNPAFTCPITSEAFEDPVIAQDGHTYQRSAITDWLRKNPISPLARIQMKIENLKPNLIIKSMMEDFRRYQNEAAQLRSKNSEFLKKFETEIQAISQNQLLEQKCQNLRNQISLHAFICPLTKQIFEEPVYASDGNTYQKKAIQNWFKTNDISPVTKKKLSDKTLRTNHATKSMIDLFKSEQKQWKNLKETDKKFVLVLAPHVRQLLNKQKFDIEKNAAQKLLSNWEEKVDTKKIKEELIKKEIQLNSVNLQNDKNHFQMPNVSENFVGRHNELDLIHKAMMKEDIVCITGTGGMGKTQLVAQYLNKAKISPIVWLNAENLLLFQIQTYLEKVHNIPAFQQKDIEFQISKFYKLLGSKGCLIFDNIQNEQDIKMFLPKEESIKVIMISRIKQFQHYPNIELKQLTDDQVEYYLKRVFDVNKIVQKQNVKRLNEKLGGIPLAISQAASFIQNGHEMTIEKYLLILKEEETKQKPVIDAHLAKVYTTLILSVHKMKQQNNQVDLLLKVIGYMSPEHLNKHLTLQFLQTQQPNGIGKARKTKIKKTFKLLCDHSIILQNKIDDNLYSINRLTQSVIRAIHKKNNTFEKNYKEFVDWLHKSSFYDEADNNDKARVCELIPHVSTVVYIEGTDFYDKKADILCQMGFLHFFGLKNYLLAKNYHEQALKFSKISPKEDKDTLVNILNQLGCVNSEFGNYQKQLQLQTKALEIAEKNLGKNSYRTTEVLNNLGDAYGHLGMYEKQRDTLLKALQIKQVYLKLNPNDFMVNNGISRTLTHIGTAYGNLRDYQKKKEVLLRALKISEKIHGKNHPETARILMNIGNADKSLGKIADSIQNIEKSLKTTQKLYGPQHLDTGLALMNLGVAYIQNKQFKKALQLLERSLAIHQKHLGKENPKTATVMLNLSSVYHLLNDFSRAKEMKSKADKILINTHGPAHYKTNKTEENQLFQSDGIDTIFSFMQGCSKQKLASLMQNQVAFNKEFQNFYENISPESQNSILDIGLQVMKKTNPQDTLQCQVLYTIGQNLFRVGKFRQAIKKYKQALSLSQKLQDHGLIAKILTELGTSHNQLDEYETALQFLTKALAINEKYLDKNNDMIAITLINLGSTYFGLGDYHKNIQVTQRAYKIFLKNNGPHHSYTEDAIFNINLAKKKLQQRQMKNKQILTSLILKYGIDLINKYGGKVVMELDMLLFSLNYDIQNDGMYHPKTLESCIQLAEFYLKHKQVERAFQTYKKGLEISDKINGSSHPFTKQLVQKIKILNATKK